MADRQRLALMALNIVDGGGRDDADAEALITAAFVSQEEAAEAYAYLRGFILEALAHSGYDGSVEGAKGYIRTLLSRRLGARTRQLARRGRGHGRRTCSTRRWVGSGGEGQPSSDGASM